MTYDPLVLWGTIVAAGLGTYSLRASFMALAPDRGGSVILRRALRLVPAAVLSALVVPSVIPRGAALTDPTSLARLVAALVAAGVAWRTRNVLLTLVIGMAVMWGVRALL